MQFLLKTKNKYSVHVVVFEPSASRGAWGGGAAGGRAGWERSARHSRARCCHLKSEALSPAQPRCGGWREAVGSAELTSACLVFSCLINCSVK